MSDYPIRRAQKGDEGAIGQLAAATFADTFEHLYDPAHLKAHLNEKFSAQFFAGLIDDPDHLLLLAEGQSGEAVAYMLAGPMSLPLENPVEPSYELHRLYVKPGLKRTGLGSRFMTLFMKEASRRGAKHLYLGVYSDNHPAQAFYKRYGFNQVGEYIYLVGPHEDHEFIYGRAF